MMSIVELYNKKYCTAQKHITKPNFKKKNQISDKFKNLYYYLNSHV